MPKHYPLLSDLIDATSIPGDFGALEDASNQGIAVLLGNLRYRDLLIEKSPDGDTAFFDLTVMSQELAMPVPGLDMDIVFFNGQTAGFAEYSIGFDWRWPIHRYFAGFETEGFSYAPEAFVDILLDLADIEDEKEFFTAIARIFFSDGIGAYSNFLQAIVARVNGLSSDPLADPLVQTAITTLTTQIAVIEAQVDLLLADPLVSLVQIVADFENDNVLATAVGAAMTAYATIEDTVEAELDVFRIMIATILEDMSDLDEKFDQLIELFRTWLGNITREDVEYLLIPQFKMALSDINLALRFPRKWLIPIDPATYEPLPGTPQSKLTFNVGSIEYSTETGFHFLGENNFDFDTSLIGKTGLSIGFSEMKLDLSRTTNIAEADAEGRPVDFMGVYAKKATIGLPKKWFKQESGATMAIIGRDLLIGNGGLSGRIGLEAVGAAPDTELVFTLGKDDGSTSRKGFAVGFSHFHMEWQQGALIESDVKGSLTVPGFKRCDEHGDPVSLDETLRIDVTALFEQDGDFQITAKPQDGLSFKIPGAFIVIVDSFEVGKEDGDVYLETSGKINFKNNDLLKTILKDPIEIKNLKIFSDGSFEIEGGSIPLPDGVRLKLGPTEVYITNLTLGAADRELNGDIRKYKTIGFSCGVSAGSAGLDLRGDGIEFWFTTDDDANRPHHSFMRIAGIGIDLIIPSNAGPENAAVIIKGYLSMREAEYIGSVEIKLPKANIAGGAAMRMQPKKPAWVLDAFLEMSVPIPLAATGLGIYGFRGLFGYDYIATKQAAGLSADNDWFDYYKVSSPPGGKGLHVGKMESPDDGPAAKTPISIGAGLSLATATDQGKAFSLQAFFMISLPELILIQGKANILGERIGMLEGDAPFFAMLAFSPGQSVEIGLGADFKQRDDGKLLEVHAEVRSAYYFQDSSAWFIHFGTADRPISARILSMFDAYAYLEISARGIATGAGVSFGFAKKYGPVQAAVGVYIDIWGNLSFEGAQVGAGLAVGGAIDVSIWGVGFGISIATTLEATVPRPFRIAGSVEVCVYVKVLVKKFEKCFMVEFVWEKDTTREIEAISIFPKQLSVANLSPVSGYHRGSGKSYELNYFGEIHPTAAMIDKVVPLDTFIDLQSKKAFDPSLVAAKIGGINRAPRGQQDIIPPKPSYKDVRHSYKLKGVSISVATAGGWQDYHPYTALSANAQLPGNTTAMSDMKVGYFQNVDQGKYTQLRLLSTTPLSFTQTASGSYVPEQMGMTSSTLYCEERSVEHHCVTWSEPRHYVDAEWTQHQGIILYPTNAEAQVVAFDNGYRIPRSLYLKSGGQVDLTLPEASASVVLKLYSFAKTVTIQAFAADRDHTPTQFNLVSEVTKTAAQLLTPVVFENLTQPVDKIAVISAAADTDLIHNVQVQIDTWQGEIYQLQTNLSRDPKDAKRLMAQIERLNALIARAQARIDVEENIGCYWNAPDHDKTQEDRDHKDAADRFERVQDRLSELASILASTTTDTAPPDCASIDDLTSAQAALQDCLEKMARGDDKTRALARNVQFELGKQHAIISEGLGSLSNHLQAVAETDSQRRHEIVKAITALEKERRDLANEIEMRNRLSEKGGYQPAEGMPDCGTYIHELCYLSQADFEFNQTIPSQQAIEEDFSQMRDAIEKTIDPVWRPNETYLIHLEVSDTVAGFPEKLFDLYFGFKSGGPLGHFNESDIPEADKFESEPPAPGTLDSEIPENLYNKSLETPETSLKFYIDEKRSYPYGPLIGHKPLYYENPKLLLFYTKPYVSHFFAGWPAYNALPAKTGSMSITIKDPTEGGLPPPQHPNQAQVLAQLPVSSVSWTVDDDPVVPSDIALISRLRNPEIENPDYPGAHCWTSGGDPLKPASKKTEVELEHLKPLKLYTALVKNEYEGVEKDVHSYTFQTSKFANLADHIDSYHLVDRDGNTRDAIFPIPVDLTANGASKATNLTRAYQIVRNQPTGQSAYVKTLAEQFADPYGLLIEGHLNIPAQHPPLGIEFNMLEDAATGNAFGILINSIEPLNDPKIPYADLRPTITVYEDNVVNFDYVPLFSQDCAQVVLMSASKTVAASDLRIRFSYIEWDGQSYVERASIFTDNLRP